MRRVQQAAGDTAELAEPSPQKRSLGTSNPLSCVGRGVPAAPDLPWGAKSQMLPYVLPGPRGTRPPQAAPRTAPIPGAGQAPHKTRLEAVQVGACQPVPTHLLPGCFSSSSSRTSGGELRPVPCQRGGAAGKSAWRRSLARRTAGERRLPRSCRPPREPYPILRGISARLEFLLSRNTIKRENKTHWKTYTNVDYCDVRQFP